MVRNTNSDEARPLIRVIDDDEDLLDAMDFMLRSEGWDVKTYNPESYILRTRQAFLKWSFQ